MNKHIQNQIYKIFYKVIADIRTEVDVELVMSSLMTENEISTISRRLAIAVFLDKGHSYQHIKETLGVSTATIASVAESLSKSGMQKALARVKAEEWADVWSIRISRALEKLMK